GCSRRKVRKWEGVSLSHFPTCHLLTNLAKMELLSRGRSDNMPWYDLLTLTLPCARSFLPSLQHSCSTAGRRRSIGSPPPGIAWPISWFRDPDRPVSRPCRLARPASASPIF